MHESSDFEFTSSDNEHEKGGQISLNKHIYCIDISMGFFNKIKFSRLIKKTFLNTVHEMVMRRAHELMTFIVTMIQTGSFFTHRHNKATCP